MQRQDQDKNTEEAQQILRRIERDNANFITGSIDSARDRLATHFSAADQPHEDAVSKWATRIGRGPGVLAFAILVLNLFTGWFF